MSAGLLGLLGHPHDIDRVLAGVSEVKESEGYVVLHYQAEELIVGVP